MDQMDQTDGPGEEVKRSKPMDRIAADAAKREQERVAKGEEFTCLLMVFSLLFVVTIAAAGRDALVKLSRGEKVGASIPLAVLVRCTRVTI